MHAIRPTRPVPAARAQAYRAARLWDDRRLRDGVELGAARRPHALAVADGRRRWTYEDLARRVDAGVAALAEAGVHPGDGVVLVSGNVAEGVVAYHALLRAGATAFVLDRRCGAADLAAALAAVGGDATVVLPERETGRLLAGAAPMAVRAMVPLERFGGAAAHPAPDAAWTEPDRDGPAVVLATSGTTRRPRAVIHSLNTLTAGARNLALVTGAAPETVAFLVSPLTSIAGLVQMHLVADVHGALVLEERFDDDASLDRLNANGATLLGGAPVIAERLLRAAAGRAERRITLRTLALGGAMLPRPLLELAVDAFGLEVVRVYGSSEAPNTTGSLPGDPRDRRLADDGALLPGSEVRVGSREDAREGLVRGPAVFLGYVDAEDSAGAFEDDWLRTGDAVELSEGRLTVVGRLKEIVNRNGLKISLGEVDGALAALPGAVEAACFGLPDDATGERLVVAIRPGPDGEPTLDAVIEQLRSEGVAERKWPEQLVVWDGPLPRTASGKIVRSLLASEAPGKPSRFGPRLSATAPRPQRGDDTVHPTPEDHVAISDLLARYCLTLDTDDFDGWLALFTPDACYEVFGRSFEGHEGLRRMVGAAPGGLHLGGPPVIEMTAPDRARTTRNLLFVDRATGESRSAVYHDELHRTPAGWRIARCRCRFIAAGGLSDRPDRKTGT